MNTGVFSGCDYFVHMLTKGIQQWGIRLKKRIDKLTSLNEHQVDVAIISEKNNIRYYSDSPEDCSSDSSVSLLPDYRLPVHRTGSHAMPGFQCSGHPGSNRALH